MNSLLIKNGLIYTGENKEESIKLDIVVKGNKIVKIGENISTKNFKKSNEILDISGCIVTPGFIEISESITSPWSILKEKSGEAYIKRGITSVVFGADGISPVPLYYGSKIFLKNLLCSVNTPINVSWENTKDLYQTLENFCGVNFGFLLGYTTLRSIFSYKRSGDLTLGEMENLGRIIAEELKKGALGISFHLKDPYMEDVHLDELFKIINFSGISKKIVVFNMEFVEDIDTFLTKLSTTFNKKSLNIELSNIYLFKDHMEKYTNFIKMLEDLSVNFNINFDVLPTQNIKIKIRNLFVKEVLDKKHRIESPQDYYLIYKKEIQQLYTITPDNIFISFMPSPLKFLENKNLKDFMEKNNLSLLEESLFKIAKLSNFQAEITIPLTQENILDLLIRHPKSILTLSENNYQKTLPNIMEKILSSGKLIHKLTELVATKLGLINRGVIKEGNYADIVIFKENLPYYVFVNGKMVLKEGKVVNPISFGSALKAKMEI